MASLFDLPFDVAPYRLSGTVYGVLLNHRDALAALGEAATSRRTRRRRRPRALPQAA